MRCLPVTELAHLDKFPTFWANESSWYESCNSHDRFTRIHTRLQGNCQGISHTNTYDQATSKTCLVSWVPQRQNRSRGFQRGSQSIRSAQRPRRNGQNVSFRGLPLFQDQKISEVPQCLRPALAKQGFAFPSFLCCGIGDHQYLKRTWIHILSLCEVLGAIQNAPSPLDCISCHGGSLRCPIASLLVNMGIISLNCWYTDLHAWQLQAMFLSVIGGSCSIFKRHYDNCWMWQKVGTKKGLVCKHAWRSYSSAWFSQWAHSLK